MLTFGSDSYTVSNIESNYCSMCEKVRPFDAEIYYKYYGILWFCFIARKTVHKICNICHRGGETTDPLIKQLLIEKAKFPFWNQYGWVVLCGLIFLGYLWYLIIVEGNR
jgi:hypothetical protein